MSDDYAECSECRNHVPASVLMEASDGTPVCRNCLVDRRVGPKVSRSVRVHEEMWESARVRAESEGVPINSAIEELLDGYARNFIDLPKTVKKYPRSRTQAAYGSPLAPGD